MKLNEDDKKQLQEILDSHPSNPLSLEVKKLIVVHQVLNNPKRHFFGNKTQEIQKNLISLNHSLTQLEQFIKDPAHKKTIEMIKEKLNIPPEIHKSMAP